MVCLQLSMPQSLWDPSIWSRDQILFICLRLLPRCSSRSHLSQASIPQQRGVANVDFVDRLILAKDIHGDFGGFATSMSLQNSSASGGGVLDSMSHELDALRAS